MSSVVVSTCLVAGAINAAEHKPATANATATPCGAIFAITAKNDAIYAGGHFTRLSHRTGGMLLLDPHHGRLQRFPGVEGDLRALVADGAGGWFAAGGFKRVGELQQAYVAHILPNGTADPAWRPRFDEPASCLALSGDALFVGGEFSKINKNRRQRLAALEPSTGKVLPWNHELDKSPAALLCLNSALYVGGAFTKVDRTECKYFVALDAAKGGILWQPHVTGPVNALTRERDVIFAAGRFADFAGAQRSSLAAFDADSRQVLDLNIPVNGELSAVAANSELVAVGGRFKLKDDEKGRNLAIIDRRSRNLVHRGLSANNEVKAALLRDGVLYAGGEFAHIGGGYRPNLAAIDLSNGKLVPTWTAPVHGTVQALAVSKENMAVGGSFSSFGGRSAWSLARFDRYSMRPALEWRNAGPRNTVHAIARVGEYVFAAGEFHDHRNKRHSGLKVLSDRNGKAVTDWPLDVDDTVYCLAEKDGTLYLGGRFSKLGGQERHCLAAIDVATRTLIPWQPRPNGPVYALSTDPSRLYVGGAFTLLNGRKAGHAGAFDLPSRTLTTWNPGASGPVRALTAANGKVFVGGYFRHCGGQSRPFVAALDPASGRACDWQAVPNGPVFALSAQAGTLYMAGGFTAVNGEKRGLAAALDTVDAGLLPFNPRGAGSFSPHEPGFAYAIHAETNAILVGGRFTSMGGGAVTGFAHLDPETGDM